MIRAVLFDIGGVLLSSPFHAFASYERERGLPEGFIVRVNTEDPDGNAWARMERGELDLAGFAEAFEHESAALGHRVSGTDVLSLLSGEVRPDFVEAVHRCAERFATALLTNNPAPMVPEQLPPLLAGVVEAVDLVFQSSVEGVRKPEAAFYERACARLGVAPDECVFLDDLGMNLKPARAMGMTTIKVNPDEPRAALAALESALP